MADESLPSIGTKAVHKDDYAKQQGPVWEVSGSYPRDQDTPPAVTLKPAVHKLNTGKTIVSKQLPLKEFKADYKEL